MSQLEANTLRPNFAETFSGNPLSPETNGSLPGLKPTEQMFVDSFRHAFTLPDLSAVPDLPSHWTDKTNTMLSDGYSGLDGMSKRLTHFFTDMGSKFQNCKTLEVLARQTVRLREFTTENAKKLNETLTSFQVRAKGNAVIFERASLLPALLPIIAESKLDTNEMADLTALLPVMIPIVTAASRASQNGSKPTKDGNATSKFASPYEAGSDWEKTVRGNNNGHY